MSGAFRGQGGTRRSRGLGWGSVGVAALTGLAAGLGGIVLTLLLHFVQHTAFGYTEQTFLTGVELASPTRRVVAMTVGGAIVGVGWWLLRRWTNPFASVEAAVGQPARDIPVGLAAADAALQIVAVGFGASLGREGAPRQVGAALGLWLSRKFRLPPDQQRTVLACGAGAGLAAVYNVPLGGALFTLEILLTSAAVRHVAPAVISSAVATAVSWPVLSMRPTYLVAAQHFAPALLVWSLLIGPLAALAGAGFVRLTSWSRTLAPAGWRLPVATTAVFAAVGALAIAFPQLLGNGKGMAQLAFDGTLPLLAVAGLLVLKPLATGACLASGATGGLLTPALATGAMLGGLTGAGWTAVWPGASIAAYAMIAAAAVLAATQNSLLCSIVLVLEFTHTGLELLAPMMLAVAGAVVCARALSPKPDSEPGERDDDGTKAHK